MSSEDKSDVCIWTYSIGGEMGVRWEHERCIRGEGSSTLCHRGETRCIKFRKDSYEGFVGEGWKCRGGSKRGQKVRNEDGVRCGGGGGTSSG